MPLYVGVALLECRLPAEQKEAGSVDVELLEAEFFDDECVVIVYRIPSQDNRVFMATVDYSTLEYREIPPSDYANILTREHLMQNTIQLWSDGHLSSERMPIKGRRTLVSSEIGPFCLALNGRAGRRVACVLDKKGTTMESIDLEGDAEEAEAADVDVDIDS